MEAIHVLIGIMAVAWAGAAAMLVFLWREVRAMTEVVEEQRTMMELRLMRTRYRRLGPAVDPSLFEGAPSTGPTDGDGEDGGRGTRRGAEEGNGHQGAPGGDAE